MARLRVTLRRRAQRQQVVAVLQRKRAHGQLAVLLQSISKPRCANAGVRDREAVGCHLCMTERKSQGRKDC